MIFLRFRDPLVAARRPRATSGNDTPLARHDFARVCIGFATVRICKIMPPKSNPAKIHISRLAFLIYVKIRPLNANPGKNPLNLIALGPGGHSTGGGHQRPTPNAAALDTRHRRGRGDDEWKTRGRPMNPRNSGHRRNSGILPFRGDPRGFAGPRAQFRYLTAP